MGLTKFQLIIRFVSDFIREFFLAKRAGKYGPSSFKWWFQVAQVMFVSSWLYRLFGGPDAATIMTDALIGLITAHAVSLAGFFAFRNSDRYGREERKFRVGGH